MLFSYIAPFFCCQALNRALYRYMEKRTIAPATFRSITPRVLVRTRRFFGACWRSEIEIVLAWKKNWFRPYAHKEDPGQFGRENVGEEPQRLARVPENPKRDPQAHRIRPIALR